MVSAEGASHRKTSAVKACISSRDLADGVERHTIPIELTKDKNKIMKKNIVSETLLGMADEEKADLLEADLKTILVITGSYLYSGADLTDIEDSVFARINELAVKYLVEQENQVPTGVTIQ